MWLYQQASAQINLCGAADNTNETVPAHQINNSNKNWIYFLIKEKEHLLSDIHFYICIQMEKKQSHVRLASFSFSLTLSFSGNQITDYTYWRRPDCIHRYWRWSNGSSDGSQPVRVSSLAGDLRSSRTWLQSGWRTCSVLYLESCLDAVQCQFADHTRSIWSVHESQHHDWRSGRRARRN